jgi:cytoskeletal protein CcmA (bactofilin family)
MSEGSVIGATTVVRGNLRGEGSLEILGRVEGDVSITGDVVVGESGRVRGQVSAGKISVLGAVQGDLRATQAVLVERGGKVAGDLSAPRIGIANGALVRGNVRTEGEPPLAAARRPLGAVAPRAASAVAAKPEPKLAKLEAKQNAAEAEAPDSEEPMSTPRPVPLARAKDKEAPRRPPPPVVPALGKGAKAKKKKSRES